MSRRAWAIACIGYSAIAIALTFPLVLHLSSVVPHDTGDPMLSTAILWWNAHVLPFTARWWNGFAYYPAPGMLAFSDTRIGESLIATPLQWMGASPVTAYNLTLLATYPLCAMAAHWLAFVLTHRHDAAAVSGVAFGFCPFRVAHIPHLELLAAFGMPVALAALHRYLETTQRRWLAVYALALAVQGLCAGYYLLFSTVLIIFWLAWFVRDDWRAAIAIGLATSCAGLALAPLIVGYARIHALYGFERPFDEILSLSGDVSGLALGSPLLALWGWTDRWIGTHSEGELFPGLTIAVLAIAGAVAAWRHEPSLRDRLDRLSLWLWPLAAIFFTVAACGWLLGPWRIGLPGVLITSDMPFKPFTIACVAIAAWLVSSSRMRAAYRRRSPLAFYLLATAALFLFSFGPKPAFGGHQILYEAPYGWLLRIPFFRSVRAPGRFAMVAMVPLALSGALAFNRWRIFGTVRRTVTIALVVAVLADGWMRHLPLPAVPDFWPAARAHGFDAVLELPVGVPETDLPAMFRVVNHQRPVLNGDSGFEPTHYFTIRTAFAEHDPAVFDGLPGHLLVVTNARDDVDGGWTAFTAANSRATALGRDGQWTFFSLQPRPAPPRQCTGGDVPIESAHTSMGAIDLHAVTDRNPLTWWSSPEPQRAGDRIELTLARLARPCAIVLSVGQFRASYPRHLVIDTSSDRSSWTTVADVRTAGLTIRAALEDPRAVPVTIAIEPHAARFIRLRLAESHPRIPWMITDVAVRAGS